ncbi:hypothetical protein [Maribacter stanieri]|uniref:hypothetical protein n=1 Tax=Maribacter stanieri TaxID=440514 RepID=UPI00249465DE|nr:hypothetical protein [Maribacter stanieri]|tara:strand:- start:1102 stop:1626 length:525 start_codon:yes stop_codon:yes gene_type:complete
MDRAYYAEKGLFVGITALICAFYFFAPTLFTFKSSLVTRSGEVTDVKTFYNRIESSKGGSSIKSELKFTLKSSESVYVLIKNIGQSGYNSRFEKLATELKNSKEATVWINEKQMDEFKPTVFQIADRNGEILYDFKESKSKSKFGFLISFGVGVFGIGLYLFHKYRKKPTHNKT